MENDTACTSRPNEPDERFRLYIDESGDHVFRDTDSPSHRYLCLLGCWFKGKDYKTFHRELEQFKQQHIPHSPDEPVILHREDIVNRRKSFWRLRDPLRAEAFDADLLELIDRTPFRMFAVVIDKKALRARYPAPAHPYHLSLGFMLQRYCGYLNYVNRVGDVMAESRGGQEDRLLKSSYEYVYTRGIWITRSAVFQCALTSKSLKLKRKTDNISGLQLADLLAHPVRRGMLIESQRLNVRRSAFESRLWELTQDKFNRNERDGRVWGYGKLLFPE